MLMKNQEPIRIAQIIGKWLGGGVESVVMNYYRHIDRTKIQFDFICDEDSTNIPYDEIKKLGGKIILVPPYQKVFEYQKDLIKIFKDNNYKIVHSHLNTLSVFPLRAAKKAGVPVRIAHSHSTTNKKEWKKNLVKQILRPFSKVYATDYMCCSELAGRWLFGNKEYDKGNVYLLNNAIDLDKFKYDEQLRNKKRKELNIKDDTLVIGHVGRFVEQKNHRFLIDIFNEFHKQNNDSLLLLVGQGPLMEEIKEKVNSLGLKDCVKFLGQRNDVSELYNLMDLFLFPSLYEGLGIVTIEAQCTKVPCIVSDKIPSVVEISNNIKFLKLNNDIEDWTNEINKSLKIKTNIDEKKLKECGYDITSEFVKLENHYKNCIKKTTISLKQKKIIFYSERWLNGGIEELINNIISNSDSKKFKFEILVGQKETSSFDKNLKKYNTKILSLHKIYNNPIFRTIKSLINFKGSINKVDYKNNAIIHINIYNSVGLIFALFIRNKKRIIFHAHNNGIDKSNDKLYVKRIANLLFKYLFTFKKCNYIACSDSAAKFCFNTKKISSFYIMKNGIDSSKFIYSEKSRIEKRKELGIIDDAILVGHVGRFVEQKNHKFLIDIFNEFQKRNPNSKLLLIGSGPLEDKIKKTVDTLNIQKKVVFLGNTKEVNKYMSAMDLFLFPSLYEGLGIVLVEAQCEDLECIATEGIPKIVKISDKLIFKNLNKNEWLLSMNEFKLSKRRNNSEKIKKFGYDIKDSVINLNKQYEAITNERK